MAEGRKTPISEELIEKKMMSFNSTQDSVQAMSLWIMHNKAHHQKIVETWLKVLRKAETKHKLTLFYLCNDVVQHAKKKKALYYLENFKDNLREAVYVVREIDAIKPNIGRVFKIWEERRTYDGKFVNELRGILDGSASPSKSSSARSTPAIDSPAYKPSSKRKHKHKHKDAHKEKVKKIEESLEEEKVEKSPKSPPEDCSVPVGDFKPPAFLEEMTKLRKLEGEVTGKAKQLASLRIDATNIEAVKQLKDRSHGNEFCRQFEESCVKIEDYVAMLDKEIRQRKIVLAYGEGAEDFYSEQFKEANIVANAYKNFGARVSNMKKRVDDMKKIIPTTPSPVPSPTADAPSPSNSPVMLNMDDNEMVDMELDNEEANTAKQDAGTIKGGGAYTAMVKSISQPIASFTNIIMGNKDKTSATVVKSEEKESSPEPLPVRLPTETFQGSNILESRIANMLPSLARGSSSMGASSGPPSSFVPRDSAPSPVPEVYSPSQPEPSPDDMESSTPVMDEPDDKNSPSPRQPQTPPHTKSSDSKSKTTPIDFLSQLLTKTNTSKSSSSNFLQTLSLLTNTVKSQYNKQSESDGGTDDAARSPTAPVPPEPKSPASSSAGNNWSGWKPVPPSQPPLPDQDPSSPPIIGQVKPDRAPPQPPPQPPESVVTPAYQPAPQQEFNVPPPMSIGQPASQSYVAPPPVPSSSVFPPPPSVDAPVLTSPRTNLGFSQTYRFPLVSPSPEVRPPLPTGPAPPTGVAPPPLPGFVPPQGNTWSRPPPPIIPTGVPPPAPNLQYIPPPPPPDNSNPWQQPPPQAPTPQPVPHSQAPPPQPPPPLSQAAGTTYSQISSVPSQRKDWNDSGEYERQESWQSGADNEQSVYVHPWDQPHDYDEEEEEADYNDGEVDPLPPPPQKSILRNSRTSSLREVTLVDEADNIGSLSAPDMSHTPKKPPIDLPPVRENDEQSEFINILKQKSSANLPDAPPNTRIDTLGSGHYGSVSQGNSINTIGVVGGHTSVNSDDMELDNDGTVERDPSNNTQWESDKPAWEEETNSWENEDKPRWRGDRQPPPLWENRDFERRNSSEFYQRNSDSFHRRNSDSDRNWQNHQTVPHQHHERPWRPRAQFGNDNFRPRNFHPRPRFDDNFHGPAKRPFFPARPRMPYFRY